MISKWILLFAIVLVPNIEPVKGLAEVMSHVTAHFGQALDECREESGLTSEILESFQKFWSDDFEVVHRELGCALICMSNKFILMQDDARMHHENMHDYVKSFPNGDLLSGTMVNLLHNCEKQFDDIEDDCSRVVKVAACFKVDAKKEGIAPEVSMIEALIHSNALTSDIVNFWNESHSLDHVGFGCLVFCSMVALDLVGSHGELVIDNAEGFLAAKGADDEMTKAILDISDTCAGAVTHTDHCIAAMELADCFRQGIWKTGWSPDIQPLLNMRRRAC
ncbi:unnamed protein product [Leptosia nina]|uniref:Uncharacterized protein n=1 Tax=Leptosia nina TaxID=320188 RepID=A0AAV1JMY3_9NEOP